MLSSYVQWVQYPLPKRMQRWHLVCNHSEHAAAGCSAVISAKSKCWVCGGMVPILNSCVEDQSTHTHLVLTVVQYYSIKSFPGKKYKWRAVCWQCSEYHVLQVLHFSDGRLASAFKQVKEAVCYCCPCGRPQHHSSSSNSGSSNSLLYWGRSTIILKLMC